MVAITRPGSVTSDYPHCCIEELRPGSTARCKTCGRSNAGHCERLTEQSWWLLDSSMCHALRLRIGTSKPFRMSWSIWDVPRVENDGNNYADWVCNLRIILTVAHKSYVLDAPLGEAPVFPAEQDVMNAWQMRSDDYSLVHCGMLYSLELGLQKRFKQHGAYEMFQELKMVFQAHAWVERYEVSMSGLHKFYSCKMEENSSVNEHILTMSGLHKRLSQLGVNLPDDSVIDRILQSLPPRYKSFVMNYNM